MKLSYSCVAAFLAHYLALKAARTPGADEQQRLAAMVEIIGGLEPAQRAALESEAAGPLRRRAELHLRRRLEAAGALQG